ncbi:hypothetical protein HDU96_006123 [Phlyctochytrium bullatum]|nr:hypothetical protein HDU96_006123 [Phlyctochytrium bullatum]
MDSSAILTASDNGAMAAADALPSTDDAAEPPDPHCVVVVVVDHPEEDSAAGSAVPPQHDNDNGATTTAPREEGLASSTAGRSSATGATGHVVWDSGVGGTDEEEPPVSAKAAPAECMKTGQATPNNIPALEIRKFQIPCPAHSDFDIDHLIIPTDTVDISDEPYPHFLPQEGIDSSHLAALFANLAPRPLASSRDSIALSLNDEVPDPHRDPDTISSSSPTSATAPSDSLHWIRARSMSYGSAVPILTGRRRNQEEGASTKTGTAMRISRSCKNLLILLMVVLGIVAAGSILGVTMSKAN